MLKGKQKKLDKNKNNRIDEEDFKILRASKKRIGGVMKADKGRMTKISDPKEFLKRRMGLAGVGSLLPSQAQINEGTKKAGKFVPRRLKLVGAALAGLASGVGASKIVKKYKDKKAATKRDKAKVKKMGGGLAAATEKLKAKGLNKGGGADTGTVGEYKSKIGVLSNKLRRRGTRLTRPDIKKIKETLGSRQKTVNLLNRSLDILKSSKKMGGGMMRRPMPMYTKGGGADMSKKKKTKSGSSVTDIFKSYGKYDGKPINLNKGGGADMGKKKDKAKERRAGRASTKSPGPAGPAPKAPTIPKPKFKRDGMEFDYPLGPKGTFNTGNPPKVYEVKKGSIIKARGGGLSKVKPTKLY